MATTHHITTKWLGKMAFESTNPSGHNLRIDASPDDGGEGSGLRPKALMLSGVAGCSGYRRRFRFRRVHSGRLRRSCTDR